MLEPLQRLFLREKPVLAILAVGEMEPAYAALIAKRIDSTFPHTSSILSELEAQGLIKSRPEGRIRYLELTDRGKNVAKTLAELANLLQKSDAEWQKLEWLRQMVASTDGPNIAFRLGPLRRDLAKLKSRGDGEFARAVQDLDASIIAAVNR
jgi:DNA-binding MarR family transcriptional regulator